MRNKKIYTSRPLSYRQWGAIRKEMYQMLWCAAFVLLATAAIQVMAKWLIKII